MSMGSTRVSQTALMSRLSWHPVSSILAKDAMRIVYVASLFIYPLVLGAGSLVASRSYVYFLIERLLRCGVVRDTTIVTNSERVF